VTSKDWIQRELQRRVESLLKHWSFSVSDHSPRELNNDSQHIDGTGKCKAGIAQLRSTHGATTPRRDRRYRVVTELSH